MELNNNPCREKSDFPVKESNEMLTKTNRGETHCYFKPILLCFVLLGTFFITFYNCGNDGYGNLYYTAAVKSMTESWHNFFFVSFDPAGFVSVDKPPIALWVHILFVKLFGFHGWSIMLPEALAAVGSVWILFHIVSKGFGYLSGIASASMLAFTPIFIAASRSNNPDSILVLVMLLAVLEVLHAAERGSLFHLILAAVFVGIGFNIKMMVAFLIVPACIITYCFAEKLNWAKKIEHLALAAIVLTVVSFSWITAVDLTPASQRPYVGSSSTNSEMDLAFGYNGFNRVLGKTKPVKASPNKTGHKNQIDVKNKLPSQKIKNRTLESDQQTPAAPGAFRLLSPYWAGQISWFLPAAIFGSIGAVLFIKKMSDANKKLPTLLLVLWISWAGTMVLFFSAYRDLTHRYYLNIIAPGLAALGGIGVVCLIKLAGQKGMAYQLLLSGAFIISALFYLYLMSQYPSWLKLLWPFDAVCILIAIILPLTGKYAAVNKAKIHTSLSIACLILLLIAPAVWSSIGMVAHVSGGDAFAGPVYYETAKSHLPAPC